MSDPTVDTGEGHAYRRPSLMEGIGVRIARLMPENGLRRQARGLYHALLGGRRGIASTLPGGEVVRVLPEYRFVTWNSWEYEAFRATARDGAIALDVGANAGAYALLMGQWVRPGGRVFAFEPSGPAFAALSRHVALNGLEDTVTPVRAAASDADGRQSWIGAGHHGTSRLADAGEAGSETVETVTIDTFCAREDIIPSLIKIDVEGFELEALRGARETIARGGASLSLFVEMHPTLWRQRGIDADAVREELARQHLRAEPLHPVADPWALEGECLRLVPIS